MGGAFVGVFIVRVEREPIAERMLMSHPRITSMLYAFALVVGTLGTAYADEPVIARATWDGRFHAHIAGAALAIDTDADGNVDSLIQPAPLPLSTGHWPAGATVERVYLYWGGTRTQPAAGGTPAPDSSVSLTGPGGDSAVVQAEAFYYSDGGAASYDVWVCRANVTQLFAAHSQPLSGAWLLSGYQGLVNDNASDHAAAALVVVASHPGFPVRRITLFDGNRTVQSSADTLNWSAPGPVVAGHLTFFTLEGDPGASSTERVSVSTPGGTALVLSDTLNPANNPMNQTINTSFPAQTGTIGVDVDRFSIDSALTGTDSGVEVVFSGGSDKWWLAAFVLEGELLQLADTDADGVPDSLDNCPLASNPTQVNNDGDLYGAACECDDANPAVHPGAIELCNGVDDNCDGATDQNCCSIALPGDTDLTGQITSSDIIRLVNFLYRSGAPPKPCLTNGDVNCDGRVNPEDVVYEVTYVFKGGQAPCDVCRHSPIVCVPEII